MSDDSVAKITHDLQLKYPDYVNNNGTFETQLLIANLIDILASQIQQTNTTLLAINTNLAAIGNYTKPISQVYDSLGVFLRVRNV